MRPAPHPRRRGRLAGATTALALVTALLAACEPPPALGTVVTHAATAPEWGIGGDPFVLRVGSSYYVYGSNTDRRLPIVRVTDLSRTYSPVDWYSATVEGMPTKPAWATDEVLWAPTVIRAGGRYVLWFAANRPNPPDPANRQCIGRAFSSSAAGPFVPEPKPFSCGLDGVHGALDPNVYLDPEGRLWLYAAFGDTHAPIHVIPLRPNGDPANRDRLGLAAHWPYAVLARTNSWEGRFIENPSMIYDPSTDTYVMSYSAGDWWKGTYSTGLARCASPIGFCSTSPTRPWLASGNGRSGPGGLSFFTTSNGSVKAVYASFVAGSEGETQRRYLSVADVRLGWTPRLSG